MSLVNEALKKARVQAAANQTAVVESLPSMVPVSGRPSPIQHPFILLAVFLTASAIGILSALMVSRTKPSDFTYADSLKIKRAAAVQSAPVVQPRLSLSAPPLPSSMTPAAIEEPTPAVAGTGPVAVVEAGQAGSGPAPAPAAQPAIPPSLPALVEGKVYLQSVEVAGVSKIMLNGILWSVKNPIATINGLSVSSGDDLGDLTVVQVEPKRVKLRAQGKEFFVRLP